MSVEEQHIIKKINIEQSFSDIVFKSARAERFGITYWCPLEVDKASIKKELCDWVLDFKEYYYMTLETKKGVFLSRKYISFASGNTCKTFAMKFDKDGQTYILCVDITL